MHIINSYKDYVLPGTFLSVTGGMAIKKLFSHFFPEYSNSNTAKLCSLIGAISIFTLTPPCINRVLKLYRYSPSTFNEATSVLFITLLLPATIYSIYLYRKIEQTTLHVINTKKQKTNFLINIIKEKEEHKIPERWHNDPIFKKFICPLSGAPIGVPIKDPIANVLYDRPFIAKWVMKKYTSPITREKMTGMHLFTKQNHFLYSLIQYRRKQLEEIEKSGKDNIQILMNESGETLLKEIYEFLNLTEETLSSLLIFPEFLTSPICCSLTGKPIRFPFSPNFLDLEPTEEEGLTCYEKKAILDHIEKQPNVAPPGWSVAKLPLPLSHESVISNVWMKGSIDKHLLNAIGNLVNLYPEALKKDVTSG